MESSSSATSRPSITWTWPATVSMACSALSIYCGKVASLEVAMTFARVWSAHRGR
jgi:hypothetical protein